MVYGSTIPSKTVMTPKNSSSPRTTLPIRSRGIAMKRNSERRDQAFFITSRGTGRRSGAISMIMPNRSPGTTRERRSPVRMIRTKTIA